MKRKKKNDNPAPWVMHGEKEEAMIRDLISFIGDDPYREGLKETPHRVINAYHEMFSGYCMDEDIAGMFKVFEDGACDEMVIVKDVPVNSVCEHHMLPFIGIAHVAYIPNGKVIGLSKIPRLVDIFARRLQIQEKLTQEITTCLDQHLAPKGSACIIEASHLCVACRGVRKSGITMVTSSLTGAFKADQSTRNEFLAHLQRGK